MYICYIGICIPFLSCFTVLPHSSASHSLSPNDLAKELPGLNVKWWRCVEAGPNIARVRECVWNHFKGPKNLKWASDKQNCRTSIGHLSKPAFSWGISRLFACGNTIFGTVTLHVRTKGDRAFNLYQWKCYYVCNWGSVCISDGQVD